MRPISDWMLDSDLAKHFIHAKVTSRGQKLSQAGTCTGQGGGGGGGGGEGVHKFNWRANDSLLFVAFIN